jgi:hypothetical protein
MVRLVKDQAEKLATADTGFAVCTPDELMARLEENPRERLMVYAPDALDALTEFASRKSGRATMRGVVFIADEAAAKRYAAVQARMIPVIGNLTDWTKVEYLGYEHCALLADPARYSREQLDTFLKTVRPAAVVLPEGPQTPAFTRMLGQADFLYAYRSGDPALLLTQRLSLNIDGLIRGDRAPAGAVFAEGRGQ